MGLYRQEHWRMVHDKPKDRLTFTPQYSQLRMRGNIEYCQIDRPVQGTVGTQKRRG